MRSRPSEAERLARGHTARRWQGWDWNPGSDSEVLSKPRAVWGQKSCFQTTGGWAHGARGQQKPQTRAEVRAGEQAQWRRRAHRWALPCTLSSVLLTHLCCRFIGARKGALRSRVTCPRSQPVSVGLNLPPTPAARPHSAFSDITPSPRRGSLDSSPSPTRWGRTWLQPLQLPARGRVQSWPHPASHRRPQSPQERPLRAPRLCRG